MSNQHQSNSIFSSLFWKFGERFLGQGISFVVSVVLTRILTPDDYGIISIVLIFMSLADVFVISGFSAALIQKKDATAEDFSTLFYCSFACSLVIYGILFMAAPVIASFYREPILTQVVRVFALRIPLSSYYAIQQAYVSRHMLFQRFFWATLFATIVSGIIGIGMACMGFGVWALIAQYFASTIVGSFVLSFTIPWHLKLKFSLSSAKQLMSYGWKVLAADFSGTFFDHLRGLIIGRVYTSTDLAYYDKGQQLPNLISSNISSTVMAVLFPAIANLGDDLDQVRQITRQSIRLTSYVLFPIMMGLAAVTETLVILLYTEKWSASIPFMQLMCISSALSLLGITSLQSLKAIGRSDVLLKLEFVKKPVYVILLLIGVQISVYATAMTMVIYTFYSTFTNILQLKKYIQYTPKELIADLFPATSLSVAMFLLVSMLSVQNIALPLVLILQVTVGIAFYIGVSALLKLNSFVYLLSIFRSKLMR